MAEQASEETQKMNTDGQTNQPTYSAIERHPSNDPPDFASPSKLGKEKIATLVILSLNNFCCGSLISLYGPFFPEEAESKGMSTTLYGLVFGAYWLMIIFGILLFSIVVPIVPAKLVHWTGVLVFGICGALFGTLDMCPGGIQFTSLSFSIRIVEGLGVAAAKTSMHCVLASHFENKIGNGFYSVETFFAIGLVLGPIIGGSLFYAQGFGLPFYVLGGATVISAVCSAFLLPEAECRKTDWKKVAPFLKQPGTYLYILMIFTTLAYTGLLLATLEPHIRQFGLSRIYLGMVFAISGFMYSFTSPAWEWLIERGMNSLLLTVFAGFFLLASLFLIGPVPFMHEELTLQLVIASMFLKGIGTGGKLVSSHYGSLKDAAHKGFPDDTSTHGVITGIYAVSVAAGACVGTSAGGYIYDTIGFANGAMILVGLEIVTIIVVFISAFLRKYQRPKRKLASEGQPILQHASGDGNTRR